MDIPCAPLSPELSRVQFLFNTSNTRKFRDVCKIRLTNESKVRMHTTPNEKRRKILSKEEWPTKYELAKAFKGPQ